VSEQKLQQEKKGININVSFEERKSKTSQKLNLDKTHLGVGCLCNLVGERILRRNIPESLKS